MKHGINVEVVYSKMGGGYQKSDGKEWEVRRREKRDAGKYFRVLG